MNLLIVAATRFEIEPLIQLNKKADILITGAGIPATIYHLTQKLLTENYDIAIQAGIAGTFSDKLALAEVVLVKEDTFADLGIEEKGKMQTLFETGFLEKDAFPFTNGWLLNQHPALEKSSLPLAKAITINKISDNEVQNKLMQQKFAAEVESMEGAAFHYVCLQQKINFLQIRSISNTVGERDKSKWKMKTSIENLNKELIKIIDNL
ncbi:MAG TPA: futalosine hydrolase [Hanamia sp.]|nr:futalosine hydrolase [Hanamia sp.]